MDDAVPRCPEAVTDLVVAAVSLEALGRQAEARRALAKVSELVPEQPSDRQKRFLEALFDLLERTFGDEFVIEPAPPAE